MVFKMQKLFSIEDSQDFVDNFDQQIHFSQDFENNLVVIYKHCKHLDLWETSSVSEVNFKKKFSSQTRKQILKSRLKTATVKSGVNTPRNISVWKAKREWIEARDSTKWIEIFVTLFVCISE